MTETTETRRRGLPAAGWLLLLALLAGFLLVTPLMQAAETKPAQASAMTSVTNGTTSQYLPIYVIRDSGIRNVVSEKRTVWGVSAVAIQPGTCVRINGGTPICSTSGWRNVSLGVGSHAVVRTK